MYIGYLKQAVRTLLRRPAFAGLAVLMLGLGIGASTATYAVLHRVVLDPLPYQEPDRLLRLRNSVPGLEANEVWDLSTAQYFHYRSEARTLDEIGIFSVGNSTVLTPSGPERIRTAFVTASVLRMLGGTTVHGRPLDGGGDGGTAGTSGPADTAATPAAAGRLGGSSGSVAAGMPPLECPPSMFER